jgi:AcrR family transcriptional regulator
MAPQTASEPARQRILRVAKSLFTSRGYEHASTSAIARTAGTSESQLMKHFGSKAGLLEAIFLQAWDGLTTDVLRALNGTSAPAEKLDRLIATTLTYLEEHPDLKQLVLIEGRRVRKDDQAVAMSEAFLEFVRLVDSILEEMHAARQLRPGLTPQVVRSAMMGMFEGLLRDRFLAEHGDYPANYDLAQMRTTMAIALNSFTIASA